MSTKNSVRALMSCAGLAALLTLGALPAVPLNADVLVMKDGSRIEIDGGWEIKGRQVRFTRHNGAFSAVRLSEVDLDASEAATELAKNPPPVENAEAATAEKRKPVLVLTNKDIGRGAPSVDEDEGESGEGGQAGTPAAASGEVVISEWNYGPGDGEAIFELVGRVENRTGQAAENIEVYVDMVAVDGDGQVKPNVNILRQASVDSTKLDPQESAEFRYRVTARDLELTGAPNDFESPRVSFDVQSRRTAAAVEEDEAPRGVLTGTPVGSPPPSSASDPASGNEVGETEGGEL